MNNLPLEHGDKTVRSYVCKACGGCYNKCSDFRNHYQKCQVIQEDPNSSPRKYCDQSPLLDVNYHEVYVIESSSESEDETNDTRRELDFYNCERIGY